MPANVEVKARIEDSRKVKAIADALASTAGQMIEQEDIFFWVPRGRLKLRRVAPDSGELIYYERENQPGPKESRYRIVQTSDPGSMKAVLMMCLGIRVWLSYWTFFGSRGRSE